MKLLTKIFVFGMFFFSAACAVHKPAKDYKTVAPPETFLSKQDAALLESEDCWWYRYNDETLNTILSEVLKNNADIEQAYSRLSQAAAFSKGKSADLFPQLSVNGTVKHEDSESYNSATTTYSVSLAASYELDLWGRVRSAKEAARLKREATLYDLQSVYISITAQAVEVYFRASVQKESVLLARKTVQLAKENLEISNLNYKTGVSDSSAVYAARQNLASAESNLVLQEAALRKLIHTLSILQNKYPELPAQYSFPELSDLEVQLKTGIPSDLLKNRPDIKRALADLKAADYDIGTAVANRFPTINLTANFGETGTDITGNMITSTFSNVAGGLILPILDWGKRKAEVKRVEAKFDEPLSAYKKSVLNGFKDAEDAIVEFSAAEFSLEKAKAIRASSKAELEQKKSKYSYGLINYPTLISSRTAAIDAESRLNAAQLDLLLKDISLVRAIGGTWMNKEIKQTLNNKKG